MNQSTYGWEHRVVLIAEDEPINFMLIRKILEVTSCRVIWAKNGREAVEMTTSQHPDLILMDIRMPEMDGITATKMIRKSFPDLPIIAVTAFSLSNEAEKCQEAGASGFITKPVMPGTLLEAIGAVLK